MLEKETVEKELKTVGEEINILRKRLHVNVHRIAAYASMGNDTYEGCIKGAMTA